MMLNPQRSMLRRRGTLIPILALTVTLLLAFIALAVDVGILTIARTNAQSSCDTSALAGARVLNNRPTTTANDKTSARTLAMAMAKSNINVYVNQKTLFTDTNLTLTGGEDPVQIGVYSYNTTTQRFEVSFPSSLGTNQSWTACRVKMRGDHNTFFAKVVGINTMPWETYATAVHRPRDIAFVVDFSGSMTFASMSNWPYLTGTSEGCMNPDPIYPQFGHYGRYTSYQNNTPSGQTSTSPASRPNPMQMRGFNGDYPPSNHTMTTPGGPPLIEDFVTVPGNPSVGNTPSTSTFNNAFKMWNPPINAVANTATLTPTIYDFSSYNATTAATPAPDNFKDQSDSPIPYVGDKWGRTDGSRGAQSSNWSDVSGSSFIDRGLQTLQQFLNSSLTGNGGRALAAITLPGGGTATALQTNSADGGNSNANYLDVVWERYGYDIDMVNLRGQTGATKTVNLLPTAQRFKGYSMGPGYYGKTWFIWPPDPRWGADSNTYGAVTGGSVNPASPSTTLDAKDSNGNWIADWRRRFFLRGDGATFNPQVDEINTILFRNSAGHVLNTPTTTASSGVSTTAGYYRINYNAIMQWIKRGPQVFPTNLRSGRIVYYTSIPDDVTESAAGDTNDKRFWRHYIHFVLGINQIEATNAPISGWDYSATALLAGVESRYPYGTLSITNTATFTPTGATAANRQPYMAHTDNINRPRQHFWFGPYTMLVFLQYNSNSGHNWMSGTVHESQCWQVKAGMNSVLDDVRSNHPNDNVGMSYFATRSNFYVPVAPMGQDWTTLKNVLFYRKDTAAALKANANSGVENRPYTTTSGGMNSDTSQIPNGEGGTDTNTGLAVAFNLLSSSPSLSTTDYGTSKGRNGAGKIVILETDGMPNQTPAWSLTGSGIDTRYVQSGSSEFNWSDPSLSTPANAGQAGMAIVSRIVAPVSTSGFSGFSTPNAPARVYVVAFGDLFTNYNGSNYSSMTGNSAQALRFALRVQQLGNTSGPGDPNSNTVMIPYEQVVTGPYQRPNPSMPVDAVSNPAGRLEKMRTAYERIMQSGIQVTLVQ